MDLDKDRKMRNTLTIMHFDDQIVYTLVVKGRTAHVLRT